MACEGFKLEVQLRRVNRAPELNLKNPSLNEDIYALIEEAQLNEQAEKNWSGSLDGNITSSRVTTATHVSRR